MSTETTNKKIKINNGTTFGRTYTDKAIDERLQGLVSTATFTPVKEKANNSLQKPAGLTKTKLVGVGTNGQENIEIGDNLTLANGKLSAIGGGGSGGGFEYDSITPNDEYTSYTGNITGDKPVYDTNLKGFLKGIIFGAGFSTEIGFSATMSGTSIYVEQQRFAGNSIHTTKHYIQEKLYSHFITMTDSASSITLYLTIQNTSEIHFTADTLASYFAGKKVLANGNLHGVVPTYIAGESGKIKIYYRTPGDNNINPQPDEYQSLTSFAISDLVSDIITPLE